MIKRVKLSSTNSSLVGSYTTDSDHIHVHVDCDSSSGTFTVQLPDATQAQTCEYDFYNNPSSGAGSIITIKPISNQTINNTLSKFDILPNTKASFVSDLRTKWLM